MALIIATTISGCSGKTSPTEANFRDALKETVSNYSCTRLQYGSLVSKIQVIYNGTNVSVFDVPPSVNGTLPITLVEAHPGTRGTMPEFDSGDEGFQMQLANAGILNAKEVSRNGPYITTEYTAKNNSNVEIRTLGKGDEAYPALCIGDVQIESLKFTIPKDSNSSVVTVSWRSEGSQAPLDDGFFQKYTSGRPATAGETSVLMQLTNEGWEPIPEPQY